MKTVNNFLVTMVAMGLMGLIGPMGCASAPSEKSAPVSTERTFKVSSAALWPVLIREVGLNYAIKVVDKDAGLLTTEPAAVPLGNWNTDKAARQWVHGGSNLMMAYSGLEAALNISLAETGPGETRVTVKAIYQALQGPIGGAQGNWVACESNGRRESELLDRVRAGF
jgi:hypothetical protein